ncbi:hypothetical protein [Streptomyces sp. NPDC093991]|uniref:hypothetical protein n=1 Tax=unclassified Streptomyces TaxID=2593676 RepID=UPI0034273C33
MPLTVRGKYVPLTRVDGEPLPTGSCWNIDMWRIEPLTLVDIEARENRGHVKKVDV